ncbi:hypothetical protein D3C84_1014350 [compost metagenome]
MQDSHCHAVHSGGQCHFRIAGQLDLQGGRFVRRQLTAHPVGQASSLLRLLLPAVAKLFTSVLVVLFLDNILGLHQPAMNHHLAGAVDVDDTPGTGHVFGGIRAS